MFKKSRKAVLNLYTTRVDAYHYAQWQKASSVKPKWWKDIPNIEPSFDMPFGGQTMKHCTGFNDLYKNAFLIPLWSDVMLGYSKKGESGWKYVFADEVSKLTCHPQFQRGEWLPEDQYQHFKFNTPWMAECTDDINFLYTSAEYQNNNPFKFFTLNGVVNYKEFLGTDVNVVLPRQDEDTEIVLPKNEILAMVVPLTDKQVEIRHHLITQDEMIKRKHKAKPFLWFSNGYKKAKKCPFKFNQAHYGTFCTIR